MNNLRGAKIIYQESKATQPSHLYFLQKDANYCEAIVTSESGAKRKLNFNVDLSKFYTKQEINNFLSYKADISSLSQVAFSGEYSDLNNKPSIPTKTSDLENDSEFINETDFNTELLKKQDKLSSYDESITIENDGNVEGNISLFEEYFEQQECVLNFTPIQIIGVYVNGIKQKSSAYTIILPKTITVTNFTSGDYIEIQYTKLKN